MKHTIPLSINLVAVLLWSPMAIATDADDCHAFDENLVSHYTFDQIASEILSDRTATQHIIAKNVVIGAGKISKSLITYPNSELSLHSYSPNFSHGLSLSAWVYPYADNDEESRFLSKAVGPEADMHYLMVGTYNQNALQFQLRTGNQTDTLISAGELLRTNRWNFVTFTYDFVTMRIFHDGVLVAEAEKSGAVTSNEAVRMAVANQPDGAGTRHFLGKMDDLRFYNGALSEQQIDDLMWHRPSACTDTIRVRITHSGAPQTEQPAELLASVNQQSLNQDPTQAYQQSVYREPVYQQPSYQPPISQLPPDQTPSFPTPAVTQEMYRQEEMYQQEEMYRQEQLYMQQEMAMQEEMYRQEQMYLQQEMEMQEEMYRQEQMYLQEQMYQQEDMFMQEEMLRQEELYLQEEMMRQEEIYRQENEYLEQLDRQEELYQQEMSLGVTNGG